MVQDHPRIRGTNFAWFLQITYGAGSPPHTRDKSYWMNTLYSIFRNHPRIRGTNGYLSIGPFFLMGSSPHTRDKYIQATLQYCVLGIIPAYAGQISSLFFLKASQRDHPRIRGKNSKNGGQMKYPMGSSPHTRDKYREYFYISKIDRIIPAYAGQMLQIQISGFCLRDHPRIRGTNQFRKNSLFRLKGSSPHTRDKYVEVVQ